MNSPVFFDNAGDERGTPQDFFDQLNVEFHFDLDAAADELNHKCELYFGKGGMAFDALVQDWGGEGTTVFLNPPYSVAGAFVAKAREEADKGAKVVLLLPVRSDNKWWHKYIWDKDAADPHQLDAARAEAKAKPGENVLLYPYPGANGHWRPGVRFRFIPGRLNFELKVPATLREWIKSESASVRSQGKDGMTPAEWYKSMVTVTGLPKMAIERILEDLPDEDLMEGAPFPSCVVIFQRVE